MAETRSNPACKEVEENDQYGCGSCHNCYMLTTAHRLWSLPSKLQQLSYCIGSMLAPLTACKDSIMRHMRLVLPEPNQMRLFSANEMLTWWQYSFGDGEDADTSADYKQQTITLSADWEVDDNERSQTTHRHTHTS